MLRDEHQSTAVGEKLNGDAKEAAVHPDSEDEADAFIELNPALEWNRLAANTECS